MAGASQAAFSLCSVLWGSLSMHAPTAPEMRTYHLAPFPFLRRLVACSAFALLLALCSHSVWAAADADADASASASATAGIAVKAPTPAPANTNQIAPNAAPVASTAPAAAPVAPTAPAASAAAETAPAAPALTSGQKLGTGTIKSNSSNHQGELASGGLNSADGIIKWLLSTIAVLGVIFAFAYFLKRSRFVQRGSGPIVLENQIALGPKERVVQVKVGERHLLLGVTSNSVNLICDLTALDAKNAAGAASVDAASAAAASVAPAASAAASAAAGNAPLMAGMNPAAPMPVQRNGLSPAMGADYAVYHQPSPYPYASYPYPPQAPQAPYAAHAPHDAQAPQAAQQGAPLAGSVGPNGVQFPAQAPVMPMPSPMSSPVPASLAGSAPIMQGMTAVEEEDEEPQFSRAGLPPLFPEDEPNYAKISPPQPQPPLMSAGQVPAGQVAAAPVAAAPAMATPAAVAPAAALASDGEDTSLALQQNAVSAKGSKRSGAVRRNRNSRKSTRRLSTGTVLGANITAPPDDSVLRARAARAQRDRHLAEIAQELEREQDSDSFAAMLAHSYKQNCAISEDSVGNRAEHSAPVTSGAQVSEVEQGSSASPLTPVQGK